MLNCLILILYLLVQWSAMLPYCVYGWVKRWHWNCRLSNLVMVYLFVYTLTLADARLCVWQLQQYQLRGFLNQQELLNYNNRTLTIRASGSESLRLVLNHRNNRVLYWNVKQISLLTCIANMNLAFFDHAVLWNKILDL